MSDHFAISDLDADHGFVVERHGSVSSTQDVLRRRLEAGEAVTGVVVRATEQTAGRGRRGNVWVSGSGGSYQSVGLTPPWAADACFSGGVPRSLLPLTLAIGVATALTRAGSKTMVKWPNDLVLGGRKLGGIIVELVAGVPIAGIGVNVANDVPTGSAALRGWDVETVGDLVLLGVRQSLTALAQGPGAVREGFAAVDWLRGKAVLLAGMDEPRRAVGIDADGCLVLVDEAGATTHECVGHVVSVDGVAWRA